jgi:hypothetical protein
MLLNFWRQLNASFRALMVFILTTAFSPIIAFLFIRYFLILLSFINTDIMMVVSLALFFGIMPALLGYFAIVILTAIKFWKLAKNKWLSSLIIAITILPSPIIFNASWDKVFMP